MSVVIEAARTCENTVAAEKEMLDENVQSIERGPTKEGKTGLASARIGQAEKGEDLEFSQGKQGGHVAEGEKGLEFKGGNGEEQEEPAGTGPESGKHGVEDSVTGGKHTSIVGEDGNYGLLNSKEGLVAAGMGPQAALEGDKGAFSLFVALMTFVTTV